MVSTDGRCRNTVATVKDSAGTLPPKLVLSSSVDKRPGGYLPLLPLRTVNTIHITETGPLFHALTFLKINQYL